MCSHEHQNIPGKIINLPKILFQSFLGKAQAEKHEPIYSDEEWMKFNDKVDNNMEYNLHHDIEE